MKRDIELEATLVAKYAAVEPVLDERSRGGRRPSRALSATAATRWFRRPPVWLGRRFARDAGRFSPWRRKASHPAINGIEAALEALVDVAAALDHLDHCGPALHRLGYRLQSPRKRQEGATHPDRNAQFEHINQTADAI